MNKFYLTTAIPYVNAKPHVGHALEFVQADTVKRFKKLEGKDVILLSGSDENAIKNIQAADSVGKDIQGFIDENSLLFENLAKSLNVEFDIFQRGSNEDHHLASQKLWELCSKNGDIYKKSYSGLYCIGCELFYEPSELNENGECFEHPGKPLEKVTEENYFFKLSKYQDFIEDLINTEELKIIPDTRKNEMLSFLRNGLQDISISRSNERAKNWGVPVPGDNTQRMYVWFDALNIYQSGIGFGHNEDKYNKYWPADLHVIGKGITRFHAIYWPAFLKAAGLKIPKTIFVHGYFTVDGQKMSKTLGNVVDPIEIIDRYGVDAIRYYFLREIPATSDGDFSERRLKEIYNADLANGLGNLIARVARLCEKVNLSGVQAKTFSPEVSNTLQDYAFDQALVEVWKRIANLDKKINTDTPWKIKDNDQLKEVLQDYVEEISQISFDLQPFLPETAKIIQNQFSAETIKSKDALFPRLL